MTATDRSRPAGAPTRLRNTPEYVDLGALNDKISGAYAFPWDAAEEHRRGLIETIEAHRRSDPGMTRTNIGGGWHSHTDLPGWQSPSVAALMAFIAESADRTVAVTNDIDADWRTQPWVIQAWANVNPPGGAANALHDHVQMNWHWSGCYYVQCDAIDRARAPAADAELGRLVFDHRWHGLRVKPQAPRAANRHYFAPTEGEAIFFPAWQHHRVEPHRQERDRISIAFNLYSPELERSRYWTHRPGTLARRMPKVHDLINRLRGGKSHSADGSPPGFPLG